MRLTISADGTTTLSVAPGIEHSVSVSGTLGGGTVQLGYDIDSTHIAFKDADGVDLEYTGSGGAVVLVPGDSPVLSVVMTGSTTPTAYVDVERVRP